MRSIHFIVYCAVKVINDWNIARQYTIIKNLSKKTGRISGISIQSDHDKKTWKEFRGSRQQLYVITKNNEEPILKWVTIESQCNDILIVKEADLQSSKSLYALASDSDSDSDD